MIRRSTHWTDTGSKRQISAWRNWLDTRTGSHAPTDQMLRADVKPYDWPGEYSYQRQILGAPCQLFFGDSSDPSERAGWGMRRADAPSQAWLQFKPLDIEQNKQPVWQPAQRRVEFLGLWPDCDLRLEWLKNGIRKWIKISGPAYPASFRLRVSQPPGSVYSVTGGRLIALNDQGEEVFSTRTVYGISGDDDGPDELGGTPIAVTLADLGGGVIEITPDPADVDAVRAAGQVAWIDPTATITGTGSTEDNSMRGYDDGFIDNRHYNYGALGAWAIGYNQAAAVNDDLWRTVARISNPSSNIPAGTITAFVLKVYRYSNAKSSASGTIDVNTIATADAGWVEGSTSGSAEVGASDFHDSVHGTSTWDAEGLPAVDTPAEATHAFSAYTAGADVQETITLDPDTATAWRDATKANGGYRLKEQADTVGKYYLARSSEYGSNEPEFEITYTAPAASGAPFFFFSNVLRRR